MAQIASVLGALAALSFAACGSGGPDRRDPASPARTVLYYRDPMHPSYTSPSPGKAPDCGMDLEPVYADAPAAATSAVAVGTDQQRLIGLELATVSRGTTSGTVRTLGRVAIDENRAFPVRTGCDGWVTRIFPGTATGATVRRGQPLASVYGPDFTTAQRSFLYALRASENPPPTLAGDDAGQPVLTLEEARLFLRNLGIGASQIELLTRTRKVMLDIELVAPASGVIVSRDVSPQQRFEKDVELFRIADLSRVWIIADLLGEDQTSIRAGATARVTVPGGAASSLSARVSDALPRFEGGSRAQKVRLDADNPHRVLRPDMLVDLEFDVTLPEATTVPAAAIVDSGHGPTVYVATGNGAFTPRPVTTGWRFGERVQIVRGVSAGESVVVSGNTLLDSETRMRRGVESRHD